MWRIWTLSVIAGIFFLAILGINQVSDAALPVIDFDTYPDGSPVNNFDVIEHQYDGFGAEFEKDVAIRGSNEASSLPHHLIGGGNSFEPMSFVIRSNVNGMPTVAHSVTMTLISVGDATVTATAFAPDRITVIDSIDVTNPGTGVGLNNQDTITLEGPGIGYVVIDDSVPFFGDGFGIDDVIISLDPPVNEPPTADAGPDQLGVLVGNTVSLDGSGSNDPENNSLTYQWSIISAPIGSFAALDIPTSISPMFVADFPGQYVIELVVNDGTTNSNPDSVTISTDCPAPLSSQSILIPSVFAEGEPCGDLILVSFKPVQAIEDVQSLITNKNTVFKATIQSTFEEDQTVKIRIKENGNPIVTEEIRIIADCESTYYFPMVAPTHLTAGCIGGSLNQFTSQSSHKITSQGQVVFTFDLDFDNQVSELNDESIAINNNQLNSINEVTTMQKMFTAVYKSIGTPNDIPQPDIQLGMTVFSDSLAYLQNFLPLPESNVNGILIPSAYNLKKTGPDDLPSDRKAELKDYLKQLADQNNAAVGVGMMRTGFFSEHLNQGGFAFADFPDKGIRNKHVPTQISINSNPLNINIGSVAIAHEIFHTYGWVDNDNTDDGKGHFTTNKISGFFHPNRLIVDNGANLMKPVHSFETEQTIPHSQTYDFLMEKFQNNPNDPPIIYMRGWIDDDGTVTDLPWKRTMGFIDLPLGHTGDFNVQYFDSSDTLLAETAFSSPIVHGEPESPITYFFNIPDVLDTKKITISRNNMVLAEKIFSDNLPDVTILEPNGGEVYHTGQSLTVKWISSDIDGDDLFHDVLLSTDSGLTWDILALDLIDTEFTYVIPDVSGSSEVVFKVITSDGINSAEDQSDSVFTIIQSIMPVGGKIIPIESTSLIVTGTQLTTAWILPVIVSAVGIGLVISRKI